MQEWIYREDTIAIVHVRVQALVKISPKYGSTGYHAGYAAMVTQEPRDKYRPA